MSGCMEDIVFDGCFDESGFGSGELRESLITSELFIKATVSNPSDIESADTVLSLRDIFTLSLKRYESILSPDFI